MVSKESADILIDIISSDNEKLRSLSTKFKEQCPPKDQLPILTSLAALLMDDILEPTQQTVSAWLLYDYFSSGPIENNPFCEILQFIVQVGSSNTNNFSQKLCDIIACFLSSVSIQDIADHTAHEINESDYSPESSNGPDLTLTVPPSPRISGVIVGRADPTAFQVTQHQLLRELLINPFNWDDFEVPLNRRPPEVLEISSEELQMSNLPSFEPPPFLFDRGDNLNEHEATKVFLREASQRSLLQNEEEMVIRELRKAKQPLITKKDIIDKILKNNSKIGAILLTQLAQNNPKLIQTFRELDLTPQNADVILELMNNIHNSSDFLENFVRNACQILNSTKDLSLYQQKAKIFIALMSSLHQKPVAFKPAAIIEIQSIMVEFERKGISEASLLKPIVN